MDITINKKVEVKENNKYTESFTTYDQLEVYRSLSQDLISKKLCNCSYIKSIRRVNNYNGTVKIIVTYDNECRSTYTIEEA